jgi:hypothetical protein
MRLVEDEPLGGRSSFYFSKTANSGTSAASLSESSCLLHESRTNIIVRMDLRSLVESAHDIAGRVGMREQLDLASAPATRRRARFFCTRDVTT